MDQKISRRIVFISFLMACVIVAFHCYDGGLEPAGAVDESICEGINNFFSSVSRLALCWFFCVSGFLLFRDYSFRAYAGKVKRRVFSLLVPYVIWELAAGVLNKSLLKDPLHTLGTVFLLQKWPPIGPLWYMYAIFLFALISPAVYLLLKWKKPWGGCVLFLLLLALVYFNDPYKGPFIYHFISYGYVRSIITYLPAYLTGCWFGIHEGGREGNSAFSSCIMILVAALTAEAAVKGFFLETVYCVLPVLMLYAFPSPRGEGRKWDLFRLSFLMYAIHSYPTVHFTPWVRNLLLKITPATWIANLAGRLVILPAVIVMAAALWLLLSAACPPLLKILTGGRVKPWRRAGKGTGEKPAAAE